MGPTGMWDRPTAESGHPSPALVTLGRQRFDRGALVPDTKTEHEERLTTAAAAGGTLPSRVVAYPAAILKRIAADCKVTLHLLLPKVPQSEKGDMNFVKSHELCET